MNDKLVVRLCAESNWLRQRLFVAQRDLSADSLFDMDGQKQIIDEIEAYIHQGGGEYQDWYVGITDNPIGPIDEAIMFHKVENHMFMYIETISPQAAESVAEYFVNVHGTDGSLKRDGKYGACQALYVYKKAVHLAGYKVSNPIQSIC